MDLNATLCGVDVNAMMVCGVDVRVSGRFAVWCAERCGI